MRTTKPRSAPSGRSAWSTRWARSLSAYHFDRALKREGFSEHLEALAHRIVLTGLLVVGSAAVVTGSFRLATHASGGSSSAAVALAAVSLVVLVVLCVRKIRVAVRVDSNALRSDGHVTAVGASFALITLAGTALEQWWHLHWADASATVVLGTCALALSISAWRELRRDVA